MGIEILGEFFWRQRLLLMKLIKPQKTRREFSKTFDVIEEAIQLMYILTNQKRSWWRVCSDDYIRRLLAGNNGSTFL